MGYVYSLYGMALRLASPCPTELCLGVCVCVCVCVCGLYQWGNVCTLQMWGQKYSSILFSSVGG